MRATPLTSSPATSRNSPREPARRTLCRGGGGAGGGDPPAVSFDHRRDVGDVVPRPTAIGDRELGDGVVLHFAYFMSPAYGLVVVAIEMLRLRVTDSPEPSA